MFKIEIHKYNDYEYSYYIEYNDGVYWYKTNFNKNNTLDEIYENNT